MFPDPATQQADVYKQVAPGFQDSPLVNQFLGTATPRPQMGPPRPQMGPPRPTTTPEAKDRSGLAYMLIALGGALRGDKNFIQNTMAIKDAQTEKERREAQKKRYQEALASAEEGSATYNLIKGLGPEGIVQSTIASFQSEEARSSQERKFAEQIIKETRAEEAEKRKEDREAAEKREFEKFKQNIKEISPGQKIQQEEFNVLLKLKQLGGDVSKLSEYERLVYNQYVKGAMSQMEALAGMIGMGSLNMPQTSTIDNDFNKIGDYEVKRVK